MKNLENLVFAFLMYSLSCATYRYGGDLLRVNDLTTIWIVSIGVFFQVMSLHISNEDFYE